MKKFKNAYEKYNFQINKIAEIKEIFDINCIKAELATILNLPGKKNIEDDFYEIIEKLRKEIVAELTETTLKQPEYSGFLGILALYYLEDFVSIKRIVNQYKRIFLMKGNHPCPVVAANTVIQGFSGGQSQESADKLQSFHRTDSGFAALHHAPAEDLLSTGVALFALNFLSSDFRLIKPDCLNFVDELYDCGGFRSTQADSMTDVEYTFYGLLALGSMC